MELDSREIGLLALLEDCDGDFGRAHALSLEFGHGHSDLYRLAIKCWSENEVESANFPLLLSESDFAACSLDTADTAPAWGRLDSHKMIAILRERGCPPEYLAMLERDRLASIGAAESVRH